MSILIICTISLLVLALVIVSILLVVGGIFQNPDYLKPWSKSYATQFSDPRVELVAVALLAPSSHNMQPWRIELDLANLNVFYLYADTTKLTAEVDPVARQTLISQGTFLEYIRVAGEHKGISTNIELFPDGSYDEQNLKESMETKPVARITIANSPAIANTLYDYLFLPDTNRGPYMSDTLTTDDTKRLKETNSDSEFRVNIFQDATDIKKLGEYAISGTAIEANIQRINAESVALFRANETEKNAYRYGFSVEGQGTSGLMVYLMQGLITLFPSFVDESSTQTLAINITNKAVAATPAYGMIISKDNNRTDQVKAGVLYSRLILVAHDIGLVIQPPSQVLEEYPEMKEQYENIHNEYAVEGGTIQMFFRVGKATETFPLSMRRDALSFINKRR